VSPVKYELWSYIPEDGILHSDRREHLSSYIAFRTLPIWQFCFMTVAHLSPLHAEGQLPSNVRVRCTSQGQ
jgi:hypothetical protein